MFMFHQYVHDDYALTALETPDFELCELKGLEYNYQLEALQIHTKNKEYFYAPMDLDSARTLTMQIGSIGASANIKLDGITIYESDEDGVLWDGNKAAAELVKRCRDLGYRVSRL